MTMVALQARVRSLELDGKEQREALEKVEGLQQSLTSVVDRLTKRVDDLADAGGSKAKERFEAMEARVAETTRMQLELAAHDDRIDALEEARSDAAVGASSEEILSLDARVGALETTLSEGASAAELARRLEAAEVGLADAQRALADARLELKRRDAEMTEVLRRLGAVEGAAAGAPASAVAPAPSPADATAEAASEPARVTEPPAGPPVALTAVKGIGPKLSEKLSGAGLTDARVLAAMDDGALDALSEASGVKRGRLERLRAAAADL